MVSNLAYMALLFAVCNMCSNVVVAYRPVNTSKVLQSDAFEPAESSTETQVSMVNATGNGVSQMEVSGVGETVKSFFKGASAKCLAKLETGNVPEARLDSPIETFGYPSFDTLSKKVTLSTRIPLNVVGGYKVPITVGAEDYQIQGKPSQVKEFLRCFAEYEVRGESLNQDGHWISEGPQALPLNIQVQRAGGEGVGSSASQQVLRMAVDRILKLVDPADLTVNNAKVILNAIDKGGLAASAVDIAVSTKDIIEKLLSIRDYVHVDREKLLDAYKEIAAAPTTTERAKVFAHLVRKSLLGGEAKCVGNEDIADANEIVLSITTYPRPRNGIRATCPLTSPRVLLGDIFESLSELFP